MPPPAASTIAVTPDRLSLPMGSDGPPSNVSLSSDWEEPHPGQRLPCPTEAIKSGDEMTDDVEPVVIKSSYRGDMAAKGYDAPYHNHPSGRHWLARRHARIKVRNSPQSRSAIPSKVSEKPVAKSSPSPIPQSEASGDIPVPPPVSIVATPTVDYAVKVLEADMDCESTTDVATRASMAGTDEDDLTIRVQPTALSSSALSFTDFSNHLGIIMDEGNNDVSVTVVDSDAFSHATNEDDVYGWEAELDRQVGPGISADDSGLCYCDEYQFRRANGGKRSLLHRVFSISNTSKDKPISKRRLSMSSFGIPG